MYYVNAIRYPLFFLVGNELAGLTFECPNNNGAVFVPVNLTNPTCSYHFFYFSLYTLMCIVVIIFSLSILVCFVLSPFPGFQPPLPLSDLYCFRPACPITNGQQLLDQFDINAAQLSQYFGKLGAGRGRGGEGVYDCSYAWDFIQLDSKQQTILHNLNDRNLCGVLRWISFAQSVGSQIHQSHHKITFKNNKLMQLLHLLFVIFE